MTEPETNPTSNFWLDQIVDRALQNYPEGEILVSSGISPSASYHIGHFREALTADAIAWGLRQRGRQARHLHVVDNFDPLRKRYHFLPESYEQYVGWPICLVPDPFDCHESYVHHFTEEFKAAAAQMGVQMDVIYSYEDQYKTGKMAPYIEQALAKNDTIKRIFKEVANRELSDGWAPIQILSDSKSFNEWSYLSIDTEAKTVRYQDADGKAGDLAYNDGRVKLNWRLDWPARWALHGVRVEPYGKEHATKGGSYDTGAEFVRQVFKAEPPLPLPYDTINLLGDNKKMSSSLGNLVTPAQALEIMPPEILRYFVLRSLPKRVLYFDSGLGLYNLIDEFSKLEEQVLAGGHPEFEQAYRVSAAINGERTISSVPFNHLVSVYQAAREDVQEVKVILERTGYKKVVADQWPIIERELKFVHNWLAKFAPESVKFSVQYELPGVELTEAQKDFLTKLADSVEAEKTLNGQGMHDAIYAAAEVAGIKPGQAFQALYRVILGKDAGPKAGWFLASLDNDWLVARLRQAESVVNDYKHKSFTREAELDAGTKFIIDEAILKAYPNTVTGYVVAKIQVGECQAGRFDGLAAELDRQGITKDTLTKDARIAAWREIFRSFGVKASDFKCSVEALARRVLDAKPIEVNSIVDAYNYISVKYLLPMGAMDLDHVKGDITLRFGSDGETAHLLGVEKPVEITPKQAVYADSDKIITWLWCYRDAHDTIITKNTKRAVFFIDGQGDVASVQKALDELVAELEKQGAKISSQGVLTSR